MKVVYSEEFKQVYSYDPASNPGRIESVEFALAGKVDYILPQPASEEDIGAVHTPRHIAEVKREGVYDIAALAAGGAVIRGAEGPPRPAPPAIGYSGMSTWTAVVPGMRESLCG